MWFFLVLARQIANRVVFLLTSWPFVKFLILQLNFLLSDHMLAVWQCSVSLIWIASEWFRTRKINRHRKQWDHFSCFFLWEVYRPSYCGLMKRMQITISEWDNTRVSTSQRVISTACSHEKCFRAKCEDWSTTRPLCDIDCLCTHATAAKCAGRIMSSGILSLWLGVFQFFKGFWLLLLGPRAIARLGILFCV